MCRGQVRAGGDVELGFEVSLPIGLVSEGLVRTHSRVSVT